MWLQLKNLEALNRPTEVERETGMTVLKVNCGGSVNSLCKRGVPDCGLETKRIQWHFQDTHEKLLVAVFNQRT